MSLQQFTSVAHKRVVNVYTGVKRFAVLERVLATVCLLIPALLLAFDDEPQVRDSISAYYNMTKNQVFYFPLTVAAMLFVVNGVVKGKRAYNVFLGMMLAGVILFNCKDAELLHKAFAIAFFGGNAVVILLFSSKKERWFKALLVAIIFLAMLSHFRFGWFSLFWAEWLSFAIIALHYVLESWGVID